MGLKINILNFLDLRSLKKLENIAVMVYHYIKEIKELA